ncbi:MAG: hypothetical protein O3B10_05400, partial [Actinomycetota bacterium]|nr:hypothetical protein [Actinomycetota bacterium]
MRNVPFRSAKAVIAIATILAIFGAGSYLLGWSTLLTVKEVEINGTPTESAEVEIAKRLNLPLGY